MKMSNQNKMRDYLLAYFPRYNCSKCGFIRCEDLIEELLINLKNKNEKYFEEYIKEKIDLCPFIGKGRFENYKEIIIKYIIKEKTNLKFQKDMNIFGIIDNIKDDFILSPLSGDSSCIEEIYPLNKNINVNINNYITYRPLGCPIQHFAKVISINNSILSIKMIGPQNRIYNLNENPIDIGICLILAFEGIFSIGKKPNVGDTVKFIPNECMMQKVHKGIVVSFEGKKIRLESIDLKI